MFGNVSDVLLKFQQPTNQYNTPLVRVTYSLQACAKKVESFKLCY